MLASGENINASTTGQNPFLFPIGGRGRRLDVARLRWRIFAADSHRWVNQPYQMEVTGVAVAVQTEPHFRLYGELERVYGSDLARAPTLAFFRSILRPITLTSPTLCPTKTTATAKVPSLGSTRRPVEQARRHSSSHSTNLRSAQTSPISNAEGDIMWAFWTAVRTEEARNFFSDRRAALAHPNSWIPRAAQESTSLSSQPSLAPFQQRLLIALTSLALRPSHTHLQLEPIAQLLQNDE